MYPSLMINKLNTVLNSLGIKGKCVNFEANRHMAFFDVALEPGTAVSKIENRTREIALGIRSKTSPIIKVMPEFGIVRLQVAMGDANTLFLGGALAGKQIPAVSSALLPFVLGETDEGETLWVDMSRNPHLLVAGGTGSGKSTLLHALIANCMVLQALDARDIRIFLSDPKGVEFRTYEKYATVVYNYDDTIAMLESLECQMESRFAKMAQLGIKSVEENPNLFPFFVVIIDEVADLMQQDKKTKTFENLVVRLAQKARAAGIYMTLATQRPSRDVLTGTIKANFPARISCKTASRIDSQVVLDMPGAEELLGRGDAILRNQQNDRVRFQVAYSTPEHAIELVEYFKKYTTN